MSMDLCFHLRRRNHGDTKQVRAARAAVSRATPRRGRDRSAREAAPIDLQKVHGVKLPLRLQ